MNLMEFIKAMAIGDKSFAIERVGEERWEITNDDGFTRTTFTFNGEGEECETA